MSQKPRNLLILMSDEHRRDAAGFMGHAAQPTPKLDKLAARGTVFERAYTPSPICVPARAAFASGLPVHRTGNWDSAKPWTGTPQGWMHELRNAGMHTATLGKLHYTAGCDHGAVEEIKPMHVAGNGWTIALIRDGSATFDAAADMARDVGCGKTDTIRYDQAVTKAAVDWLHAPERNEPWAAMVSLVTPHYPLTAPQEWIDQIDPEMIAPPVAGRLRPAHPELARIRDFYDHDPWFDDEAVMVARRSYLALVAFMDDCMGQVLSALEQSGQTEETLIVYVSDHGEMLGDHGFWGKSVMLESSVGVPMIVSGPGVPVGRCKTPTSLLDIATTALATFDLDQGNRPGADLRTLANQPDDAARTAFSEHHDGGSTMGAFMVRWDNWKYIHYAAEAPQLFDLDADPDELRDLTDKPEYSLPLSEGRKRLAAICDAAAVEADAISDQAARLLAMGGREAALNNAFSHTPIPDS
ncbi:choline-sulfatase [Phaeobacter inhibens]|uniref:sulfatase-like hydrolase/transferase n=1 Tax=Phaeobacter inhibens TaxID=221822 RepID=UPI0001632A47|nr:sulfatase-like hydrolase/transferase [Phaeobacter inhibens]AFO93019.1 putative choline-sulfatase [Phaeobacter inhibens DSM 17395]AUQ47720.1 putative choline-sulfatase [Phaeobacter inhibens]AXT24302.1 choline-sulfatase [Phaeobacter inhibens]